MQPSSDVLSQILQFLRELVQSMGNGLLFFGGPFDLLATIGDIVATTVVIYYVLKLLRHSRAWQLLKGLLLIFVFALIAGIFGFNTIGFLLNNTISLLAIAIVVLFQPELRRALETVGRSKFNVLNTPRIVAVAKDASDDIEPMIEQIVNACDHIIQEKQGALMIFERQTGLSEFVQQENAVQIDSELSAAMLRQIFYTGSPLHDGAILISDNRILAARIHVPLADSTNVRTDFGTRHRAAMGASEIGDTVALVVSEEHGTISFAENGQLRILSGYDDLRQTLRQELGGIAEPKGIRRYLGKRHILQKLIHRQPDQNEAVKDEVILPTAKAAGQEEALLEAHSPELAPAKVEAQTTLLRRLDTNDEPEPEARDIWQRVHDLVVRPLKIRRSLKHRLSLIFTSIVIAISLWLYIQVTINPISEGTYTVSLNYRNEVTFQQQGLRAVYPMERIKVTITARKKVIDRLTADDVVASIDMSQINTVGQQKADIEVVTNTPFYTKVTSLNPDQVVISVRSTTP